jgi:undecaprenyl-diphosphatase
MEIIKSLILSLVQALTEFLPISSSGHLLLFKNILNFNNFGVNYDIIIHFGSLFAIILFFYKNIIVLLKGSVIEIKNFFDKNSDFNSTKNLKIIIFSFISTITTFIIYKIFEDKFLNFMENPKILPFSFLFTTFFLVLGFRFKTYYFKKKLNEKKVYEKNIFYSIIIGIIQSMAILPGVSRSGSTISSAFFFNIEKEDAFFYSFLLSIFAIVGSVLISISELNLLSDFAKSPISYTFGFIGSFVFSFLTLKLLKILIKKNIFFLFSIYTFILSIISFIKFY